MYGARFSLGPDGDVYLVGRVALEHLTDEELDRIIGVLYELTERWFQPVVQLAYGRPHRPTLTSRATRDDVRRRASLRSAGPDGGRRVRARGAGRTVSVRGSAGRAERSSGPALCDTALVVARVRRHRDARGHG